MDTNVDRHPWNHDWLRGWGWWPWRTRQQLQQYLASKGMSLRAFKQQPVYRAMVWHQERGQGDPALRWALDL